MTNKTSFTKIAKRILHPHTGLHSPNVVHPTRDWFIGLLLAFAIFGAAALWSVHSYTQYKNISLSDSADDNVGVIEYRESWIDEALKTFADRQIEHEQLLNSLKVVPVSIEEGVTETTDSIEPTDSPNEVVMDVSTEVEQPNEDVLAVPEAEVEGSIQLDE